MAKVANGQEEKKFKMESPRETESLIQFEGECFIEQLAPEILSKILKLLDIKSLAVSRLLGQKWNDMARKILQSNQDLEIEFDCRKTEDGNLGICGRTKRTKRVEATLENFIKCFKDSSSKHESLYTRFCFNGVEASLFDHADWLIFSSVFGKSIKCLKLVVGGGRRLVDVIQFVEKLRNLLRIQLPNLQEFGLEFTHSYCPVSTISALSSIQLFPTTTAQLQLPNLKVLHLDENCFSRYTRIFTDLLRAAGNLQEIKPFYEFHPFKSIQSLYLLQSLGKLGCLQTVEVRLNKNFLSKIRGKTPAPLPFKLKRLNLRVQPYLADASTTSEASHFLSNLFKANQETLNILTMNPIGFLPHLQLPKFNKLTYLGINWQNLEAFKQVLPSGFNLMDIFPVLQNLNLGVPWVDLFPHGENPNVSCFQTLKTLIISGRGLTAEVITRISQACPNLTKFAIHCKAEPIANFPEVGSAIWTHLKQLESLNLQIDLDDPANYFPAVDSCFTGFSRDACVVLCAVIKAEESSQMNISQSKSELEKERKTPSILDLKGLKTLTVCLRSDIWMEEENPGMSKKLLSVSEEYAFKLMDHLNYQITKDEKSVLNY